MTAIRYPSQYRNVARTRRNVRRRAFKQLDASDKQVIKRSMDNLKIIGLSDVAAFDLVSALGEWLAKVQT